MNWPQHRHALTRIDAVTGFLAFAMLAAFLISAACGLTEAARRTTCADHLRQLGRSCRAYAESRGAFLPNNQQSPFASWNTQLLPFLGEQALHARYHPECDWWDDEESSNRLVGATRLEVFLCPTAPHGHRTVAYQDSEGHAFRMAPTDFVGSAGAYLHGNAVENLFRGALAYPGRYYGGSDVTARRAVKLGEVVDGASRTLLIVEMADKPNVWRRGKLAVDNSNPTTPELFNPGIGAGNWSAPNWNHLRSYDVRGEEPFGPCGVNCSNSASIYGFHPGGANVAFVDGSVAFLRDGLPEEILVALVSISGSEILAAADFETPTHD
jgi:prepilin-type processing-associated H-X9-DG protein